MAAALSATGRIARAAAKRESGSKGTTEERNGSGFGDDLDADVIKDCARAAGPLAADG
jgi:hypothetical protein